MDEFEVIEINEVEISEADIDAAMAELDAADIDDDIKNLLNHIEANGEDETPELIAMCKTIANKIQGTDLFAE